MGGTSLRYTVIDVENTVTKLDNKTGLNGAIDNSPFNPKNRLVSVGYKSFELDGFTPINVEQNYLFFHHNELKDDTDTSANFRELSEILDRTDICVGHNIKHDLKWLRSTINMGSYRSFDTILAQYILNRGNRQELSLEYLSEFYSLSRKKTKLIEDYWAAGIGFEAIPIETVREYGIGDIETTTELFLTLQSICSLDANKGLKPTLEMSNEYLEVLTDIECNGVKIDFEELDRLEKSYNKRLSQLSERGEQIVQLYLGSTRINFNSPQQLSELIYSRTVTDKKAWVEKFNIGVELRGASNKPKRRPRMKDHEFNAAVRSLTKLVYKTDVKQCDECHGIGKWQRTKKNGEPWAKQSTCTNCSGSGLVYTETKTIGGFKLSPHNPEQVAAAGFSTDKEQLQLLALETKDPIVKEFLDGLVERNAITTYLDTVIAGIRRYTQTSGFLHGNFLQFITATGRTSSVKPNLQNMPRNKTFPIRAVFVSRFDGGKIIEFDYKGLEYRVAVDLAHDEAGYHDITNGVDPHGFTASHIGCDRQSAKPHTFAPLYGAMANGKPERVGIYYNAFMEKHKGIARWQQELQDEAIATKLITLPSGRQYSFPNATRTRSGGSTGATAIKNYPVQGFATADVVPCGGIRLRRAFIAAGLKSLIVLTVHDSFVIDYCPEDDYNVVLQTAATALKGVVQEVKEKYGYDFWVPIDIEAKVGQNWRDGKEISC